MQSEKENVAGGFVDKTEIEDGFFILKFQNEEEAPKKFTRNIDQSYIQFHFCVKGSSKFLFNSGNYQLPLEEEHSLLLYNPEQDLPLNLELEPKSWIISLLISIKKFHSMFSQESGYIPFLSIGNRDKKYY